MPDGIIKKDFKNYSMIIDGINGKIANIDHGISYEDGFSDMIGLSENEISVLIETIRADQGLTTSEAEMRTNLSEATVRSIISNLQNKRLITYAGKIGRSKAYVPLVKINIPKIKRTSDMPLLDSDAKGRLFDPKIEEDDMRNVLKAINKKCDIVRFETFFYPVYFVNFENTKLKIDGISGREL